MTFCAFSGLRRREKTSVILSEAKNLHLSFENKQMQILRFAQNDRAGDSFPVLPPRFRHG